MTDKLRTKIAALVTILALGGLAAFAMASNPGPDKPAQPAAATGTATTATQATTEQDGDEQEAEADD